MSESTVYVRTMKPEMKIGRRLIRGDKFGVGGMSELFNALDANLLRSIVMKVVVEEKIKDEHSLGGMVKEAQTTAQLDHPNIVPIYELGIDKKKRLFFTMKKVQGKALDELINEQDLSAWTDSYLFDMIQIMLKVCDALSYAHSKGVLHRDIAPKNIMVGEFGEVYLMDWGVAHPAGSKEQIPEDLKQEVPNIEKRKVYERKPVRSVGTPCYMSPEQASGHLDTMDARSDVFSLGATLYHILTGTYPITGKRPIDMLRNAQACKFDPPNERVDFPLSERLVTITMKAMSKDPADRYQSVEELKKDLESFLAGSERFPVKTYSPGEVIVREGDVAEEAYIIRSGECRVYQTIDGKRHDLEPMGPGRTIGELAIFRDKPRSATVIAAENVTVAVVTKEQFEEEIGPGAWLKPVIRQLADLFLNEEERARRLEEQLEQKPE